MSMNVFEAVQFLNILNYANEMNQYDLSVSWANEVNQCKFFIFAQPVFTYWKLAIEKLEQGLKYIQS